MVDISSWTTQSMMRLENRLQPCSIYHPQGYREEKEFKEVIGDNVLPHCSSHNVTVDYAFQDINDIRELCRKNVQST